MRVILVEPVQLLREAIACILETKGGATEVVQAAGADEALAAIAGRAPDVVLIDLALPGAGGLPTVRELSRKDERLRILALSVHDLEDYVSAALDAGALGFALKTQPYAELASAIRTVASGRRYLPPGVERRRREFGAAPQLGVMSPREAEVFDMLVRGHSNHAVADRLDISAKTVETHRAHIMRKLNLHSISDLILFAVKRSVLSSDRLEP